MRRVDPKIYTRKYYLSDASGYHEFKESFGKKLEPRLKKLIDLLPNIENLKILDIGCGRGEMVFWCAKNGASEVIGVDYSKDAIDIANEAKKKFNLKLQKRVKFMLMDGMRLKFKNKSFDGVLLIEVLEHLYPEEQVLIMKKIRNLLKDDGFLFIHTAPSRWFNDFAYKFWCYPVSTLLIKINKIIFGNDYPNIPRPVNCRTELHKIMHVNEPDYFSLRKLFLKSGFKGKIYSTNITVSKPLISWKDRLYNIIVYLIPLSCYFPFNIIWGNDYYALLKKNDYFKNI